MISFLSGEISFLLRGKSFLLGENNFLPGEISFLLGENSSFFGENSFLSEEKNFLRGTIRYTKKWCHGFTAVRIAFKLKDATGDATSNRNNQNVACIFHHYRIWKMCWEGVSQTVKIKFLTRVLASQIRCFSVLLI